MRLINLYMINGSVNALRNFFFLLSQCICSSRYLDLSSDRVNVELLARRKNIKSTRE